MFRSGDVLSLTAAWTGAGFKRWVLFFLLKKILISRGKKLNLQTENGKRRSTCLVIMIMLSEAHWHNEGIITNYAGLCFHTFMTIRHGSGQVVADFRQSPLAGTKEFKRRWETVHPL